jgi:protein required for attachment to host cells
MKIGQGMWVVVCDGKKALLLENQGDDKYLNLKTKEVYEQQVPKTHELGSDEPGRSFQSAGSMRSAMDQTDWHDESERAFLEKLVKRLDVAVQSGETKSLILVAPPRALGVIRNTYSHNGHALKTAIRGEIDKDFVRMPVYEIERHLSQ